LWPARRGTTELLDSFGWRGPVFSAGVAGWILAQMLAEQDARTTAHREFEHERWESVLATARRYGVDPKQAEPVRAHAVQLYRELKALHELPAEYESCWRRRRCCAIREVYQPPGTSPTFAVHCVQFGIYGLGQVQRTLVSAIARYLGKSRPQPGIGR